MKIEHIPVIDPISYTHTSSLQNYASLIDTCQVSK